MRALTDEAPLGTRAASILDAARICFERYGFHAASMARIADEADISVGHIYRYFANKEAVVFAIVRQDLDEIGRDIQRLDGSPEELAAHALKSLETSRSRQKTILRLEVMAEGARNPKVAVMVRDLDQWIRARVKLAIASAMARRGCEPLDDADLEMRTSLVGVLMEGMQLRAFSEGDSLPDGVTDQVRRLLVQVFSPAPISADVADPLCLDRASSRAR